jgi:hypothetical protein
MTFFECDSANSVSVKFGALIDYATDSFSCRGRHGVRAVCNCSYHCQKQTTIWKGERTSVILCTESEHLTLMRLAYNVVNMAATEGAVTKVGGYCSLMKQNCKQEIFMACCALYFGVVYLYFCTR